MIVQNVEGGGGTTGTSQAVNSKADGYTLAICSNGGYLINPEINEVGYTWETTTPFASSPRFPSLSELPPAAPMRPCRDLIDAAAAAPGSVTYVSPGANSTPIFWLPPLASRPACSGTTPPTAAPPPPLPS